MFSASESLKSAYHVYSSGNMGKDKGGENPKRTIKCIDLELYCASVERRFQESMDKLRKEPNKEAKMEAMTYSLEG